jgi:hypothetical protein
MPNLSPIKTDLGNHPDLPTGRDKNSSDPTSEFFIPFPSMEVFP